MTTFGRSDGVHIRILSGRTRLVAVLGLLILLSFTGSAVHAADSTVTYYLPYELGTAANLTQGPGGSTSHQYNSTRYAYDWVLAGKKEIWASAPGVVTGITTHVTDQTGQGLGNHVVLKHYDNTCTVYAHMKFGSVQVSLGAKVRQGEVLGLEGNTGHTEPLGSGHHLHFTRINCSTWQSIAIDFQENSWLSHNPGPIAPMATGSPTATGDFNGDGIDDLAVGAPGEGLGTKDDAGIVHIFYGASGANLTGDREHDLHQKQASVSGSDEPNDFFGGWLEIPNLVRP